MLFIIIILQAIRACTGERGLGKGIKNSSGKMYNYVQGFLAPIINIIRSILRNDNNNYYAHMKVFITKINFYVNIRTVHGTSASVYLFF